MENKKDFQFLIENKINYVLLVIVVLNLSFIFSAEPNQIPLTINDPIKASLPDKS